MRFGQYELLARIAVGGMAEVYEGRVVGAEGFEKHVAIKRILPDLAEDDRFVKMLLTEARIHSALSHRNIVQIHDLGISEDGEYFIVLEYVEGYDLRVIQEQLSAQGEILPEALSLHIAAEVAQGLHFAHDMRGEDGQPLGLIHRDVSPSNVLISNAGEVKLSDFGLAKRRQDRSFIGSIKGNLAYMSPEQARQAELDRRTDIFSLGAVLFEMLTGKGLRDKTADEVRGWNHVASGVIPSARAIRPELPPSFESVLSRALAVDPAQRFPDAASFGAALRELLVEMNTPVGASDLQALLGLISPARRPRSLIERSKVIRLGPEADALHEAIAAPLTPPPAPIIPAPSGELTPSALLVTPPPVARTPPALVAEPPPVFAAPAHISSEFDAMPATPPATAQPARAPNPRSERPTPRGPLPLTRTNGTARANGTRQSQQHPIVSQPQAVAAAPAARPGSGKYPAVFDAGPGGAGGQLWAQPAPSWPQARSSPASQAWAATAALAATMPAVTPRAQDTARTRLRRSSSWRPLAVMLAVALLVAASVVHMKVIPLDVLYTWWKPATMYIAAEPEGSVVTLDGVALDEQTPARTSVKRDRADHILEVTHPGFLPARETIRYDRQAVLSFMIRLQAAPAPPPAVAPTAPPAPTAAAAVGRPAPHAAAAAKVTSKSNARAASRTHKVSSKKVASKKVARGSSKHARSSPRQGGRRQ